MSFTMDCEEVPSFIIDHTQKRMICNINPLVYVTILDAYQRRDKQSRIIGTLMGIVSEGNVVEVVDCFQVVHQDSDKGVSMDKDYHRKMVQFRQAVHPKETVIGWFCCGSTELDADTLSIHNFYRTSKEALFTSTPILTSPIFLQIDTQIRQRAMPIGIAVYTTMYTPCCENLQQFHQIAISKTGRNHEEEHAIMDMLIESRHKESASDSIMQSNLTYLKDLLLKAKTYVEKVKTGECKPDPEVGRALSHALGSATNFGNTLGEDTELSDNRKDIMLLLYLSNLAQTQIQLAEKVTTILGNTNEN